MLRIRETQLRQVRIVKPVHMAHPRLTAKCGAGESIFHDVIEEPKLPLSFILNR